MTENLTSSRLLALLSLLQARRDWPGALLAELQTGRLRAGLDVIDPEPLPADHPLWQVPNVLISPHVGGASSAFLPRADRLIREQLVRFAAGRPLLNQVLPR